MVKKEELAAEFLNVESEFAAMSVATGASAAGFGCDNCYGVCPDNAIIKLGTGEYQYEIDYDYSKGCGLCAAECPSAAIEMEPEPS